MQFKNIQERALIVFMSLYQGLMITTLITLGSINVEDPHTWTPLGLIMLIIAAGFAFGVLRINIDATIDMVQSFSVGNIKKALSDLLIVLLFASGEMWSSLVNHALHAPHTVVDAIIWFWPAHAAITPSMVIAAAFVPLTTYALAKHHASVPQLKEIPIVDLSEYRSPFMPSVPVPTPIEEERYGYVPGNAVPGVPTAPLFPAVPSVPGKMILGYAADGPVMGTIEDLLSVAVVGMPGRGKSTLLYFLIAQMLRLNADIIVYDPHAGLSELAEHFECYDEAEDIERSSTAVEGELERRKRIRRENPQTKFKPLLLIVDEFPVVSAMSEGAVLTINRLILEGRKYAMYPIIASQGVPARLFGDSLGRENISSRYIFECSDAQARMAGLDKGEIETLLPKLNGQKGVAILKRPAERQGQVIAVPMTTVADIKALLPEQGTSLAEEERIIALASAGVPRRQICAQLGKGKSYYGIVKRVLDTYEQLA